MLLNDYQYKEDVYIDYLSGYEDYEDSKLDYPGYLKPYVKENEDNSFSETDEEDFPWMLKEKEISNQESQTNQYFRNIATTSDIYNDINREYDGLENLEEDFDIDEFDIDVYLDWYYDDLLEVYKLGKIYVNRSQNNARRAY